MIAGQPDYATLSGVTQAPEFCRFECDVALTALLMDGCHRAYNTSVREVLLAAPRRCCRHGTAVRTVTSRWNTMAAISMTIRSGLRVPSAGSPP